MGNDVILRGEVASSVANITYSDMHKMAVSIAKSGLFGVKDPDQALALMMIAQAEGKHPALIARDYDVIQGRPAKKSEAMLRDFQSSGGKVEWLQLTDSVAEARFSHPNSPKPLTLSWDLARATQAGLTSKTDSMYKKYPRSMLRSRLISEGCRAMAPGATSGAYTPEEIRDADIPAALEPENAAAVGGAMAVPQDEYEAHVNTMDGCTTLKALEAAFGEAWKSTKDAIARERYKGAYETMKHVIADVQARELADGKAGE